MHSYRGIPCNFYFCPENNPVFHLHWILSLDVHQLITQSDCCLIVTFFKQIRSDTGLGSLKIQASPHIVTGESLAKFLFAFLGILIQVSTHEIGAIPRKIFVWHLTCIIVVLPTSKVVKFKRPHTQIQGNPSQNFILPCTQACLSPLLILLL